MLAWYTQVKLVHVAAVLLSGALFLLRGVLVQAGRERYAMFPGVRYASYLIDTVLLIAALLLVAMLPGALFANHWLTFKVALLVVYIVLGSLALSGPPSALRASGLIRARERPFALKRARTPRMQLVTFIAALLVYAAMLGVARAHHPLGWLVDVAR